MHSKLHYITTILIILALSWGAFGDSNSDWPFEIQVQHKPGTYWWCPGSAWDKESIDWNLENLKNGGIGTVHIVPIYGAKGYEDRYIQFLSNEWIESFQYILQKADALGLQVDMTTGTGWCFGGPDLNQDQVDLRAGWDAETGKLTTSASRMVKRAAPGGEGHMLNPYSQTAMQAYLKRFNQAFAQCERLPRSQYHDSFEYAANWCVDMPSEFKKRRDYGLQEHLKTVFGKSTDNEKNRRVKYDYRLTIHELHHEFIKTWADWASRKGMLTRNQAHGAPANLLDIYALADMPETEMFGSPEFPIPGFRHEDRFCRPGDSDPRICKMASSAAHVAHEKGKQLVTSESCTWMREHWHGTLGQIKLEMDLFFLAGVNHVFYHGSCYSAKDAPWPGWFFYASTKADWRNAIWRDMPFLNQYIARCQSMLQAGQPANDILLYWPIHDLWMDESGVTKNLTVHSHGWMDKSTLGDMASRLDEKGFAYDFISDRMLDSLRCKNGTLTAPGGDYRCIVVPHCEYMPVQTMKRLAALSAQGAIILFENTLPRDVPGFHALQERRQEFNQEKDRLKGVVVTKDIVNALTKKKIHRETMADRGLRYIRRKTDKDYWYFVANHTKNPVTEWIELAVPFSFAVLHDPMTGRSLLLPAKSKEQNVYLHIEPGESFIIQASQTKQNARPYVPMKKIGQPQKLQGEWQIDFIDGGPELPQSCTTKRLSCWTGFPDPKTKAFAGTARYTLTFELPLNEQADEYRLDLGDVRESARVKINGKAAANLFALPMRCHVGRYLREGKNTLAIEVTNLAANRIRDLSKRGVEWKIMRDINIVNMLYKPFDATKWPLQPSGLLGPVTLTPLRK